MVEENTPVEPAPIRPELENKLRQASAALGENRPVKIFGGNSEDRIAVVQGLIAGLDPERTDVVRINFEGAEGVDEVFSRFGTALKLDPEKNARLSKTRRASLAIEDRTKADPSKQVVLVVENLEHFASYQMLRSLYNDTTIKPGVLIISSSSKNPDDYQEDIHTTPYNIGQPISLNEAIPPTNKPKR